MYLLSLEKPWPGRGKFLDVVDEDDAEEDEDAVDDGIVGNQHVFLLE